ncbi:MAG: asparagine synthase (glutamine-hydrolyzing) [Chloroflexi bacterium]|nr:MAG: asparagine synthase (glutamine-hydrolyzing) [Chloroflexota bacterium]
MCGIVGSLNQTTKHPITASQLQNMLGAIRHRGPDQFGIYRFQDDQSGVGLGNARLSIIDLDGGQQPISNEDGTIWIVFNGEIFNYIELTPALKKLGHQLATNSDTEIIVHLYEEYGVDCVHHLNGQFAFAIWDEREHTLFIARDRVGIRPLYYTEQDGALLFASEIKALLTDPRVPAALDPVSIDQIFTYWSPLSPRTAFKNIYTLPPGHWLLAKPGQPIQIEPYWQPQFPHASTQTTLPPYSLDEAALELLNLLVDATQIRLRADVPVGAYLSGGLDSSAITAFIRHYTDNKLETFSIAFTDEAFDETPFQQQMAHHLGTQHHIVTASHRDIGDAFPQVIWHTETPITRTSPVPLFLLSKLVQDKNFKVVLTGEGSDEFLGGYNIFKENKVRRFWAKQPQSEMRPLLITKLYPYISNLSKGNLAYLQKFFGYALTDTHNPYYSHLIRWRNTSRAKRVFSNELKTALHGKETAVPTLPADFDSWTSLAQAQYLEITLFMAEYLLSSQGDRVGMGHSIEGRFPFLDHRVVEYANQLPPQYKMRGVDEKHILKRAVSDILPDEIWNRPKRPYRAPIHRSFFPEKRPLSWVQEMLSSEKIQAASCFNPNAIANLKKKIERLGQLSESDDMTLAGVLSTQLVYEQFIAKFQPPPPINKNDDIKIVNRTA